MSERFRVMVIDDDPGVREYMEALITQQGYEVEAAADGEEGHELEPNGRQKNHDCARRAHRYSLRLLIALPQRRRFPAGHR